MDMGCFCSLAAPAAAPTSSLARILSAVKAPVPAPAAAVTTATDKARANATANGTKVPASKKEAKDPNKCARARTCTCAHARAPYRAEMQTRKDISSMRWAIGDFTCKHRPNPSARTHRYLDAAEHAKCLALLATAGNGKTPIMLLHELATRRQLDIAYTTSSPDESQVGGLTTHTAAAPRALRWRLAAAFPSRFCQQKGSKSNSVINHASTTRVHAWKSFLGV